MRVVAYTSMNGVLVWIYQYRSTKYRTHVLSDWKLIGEQGWGDRVRMFGHHNLGGN